MLAVDSALTMGIKDNINTRLSKKADNFFIMNSSYKKWRDRGRATKNADSGYRDANLYPLLETQSGESVFANRQHLSARVKLFGLRRKQIIPQNCDFRKDKIPFSE